MPMSAPAFQHNHRDADADDVEYGSNDHENLH